MVVTKFIVWEKLFKGPCLYINMPVMVAKMYKSSESTKKTSPRYTEAVPTMKLQPYKIIVWFVKLYITTPLYKLWY